jgi:putative flippase GtrA
MHIAPNYLFLVRYGIVGLTGGLIQTSVLYLWVSVLLLQKYYLIGAVVGFCLALAVTFLLQKHWTFQNPSSEHVKKQFFSYTLIALVSLGLNIFLLHISKGILEHYGFDFFRVWYLLAQVAIIGFIAVLSFIANNFLTFRTRL